MYLSLGLESALVSTIGPAFTASSLAFAQSSGWFRVEEQKYRQYYLVDVVGRCGRKGTKRHGENSVRGSRGRSCLSTTQMLLIIMLLLLLLLCWIR